MKPRRVEIQFDPDAPVCPGCKSTLTPAMKKGEVRYDKPGLPTGCLRIYQCGMCGAPIGVFIPDRSVPPDEKWTVTQ